ncbi:3147_t:CDS:2, partial [Funneliformis mosseae]
MSDDETDEAYNEFIKEFGLKYKWDNTKAVRHWREKALKQFVYALPSVKNPMSLFHVFLQFDAFYLSQILSLIKLPYYPHELREKIWPDGIEKFRCRLFIQDEESIVDYCLKAKKCNDIVKLCKDHFRSEFYSRLTRENMRCIAKNDYYRELVEMLIQAKKESVTGIITGFKDYINQSGIANLNGIQYLLR